MSTITKKFDTREKVKKSLDLVIGGRVRDKEKILAAVKKMDAIRKRLSAKLPPSDSTKIIRKFRDSR
jgi:hypothetical protein